MKIVLAGANSGIGIFPAYSTASGGEEVCRRAFAANRFEVCQTGRASDLAVRHGDTRDGMFFNQASVGMRPAARCNSNNTGGRGASHLNFVSCMEKNLSEARRCLFIDGHCFSSEKLRGIGAGSAGRSGLFFSTWLVSMKQHRNAPLPDEPSFP